MKYVILISAAAGAALLYFLSSNSANTELFSNNYYNALFLTGLLVVGLSVLVLYQLWQLRTKLKNKVFGSKLTMRLALFFIGIAVLPGILVYAVSVEFLSKSIESWFDVRVEKALEGGLNLGKNALDNSLRELSQKTQFVGLLLAEKSPSQYQSSLRRLIDEGMAQEAAVFTTSGKPIAFASVAANHKPVLIDPYMMAEVTKKYQYMAVDTVPNKGLILRVLVLVKAHYPDTRQFVLQFTQPVPPKVEHDAETVQGVYRDYQALVLSRVGLKRLYGITLTLSLLIVLLAAVSAAFFISDKLGSSLEALAEGTRAVAQGDFSGEYPVRSQDELGALTGLFNQMIRQLAEAKATSELQQQQVESAKGYLESVLTHLSSGVIGFDTDLRLRSVNTRAGQILSAPLPEMQRMSLVDIAAKYPLLTSFCSTIHDAFAEVDSGEWRKQIERTSKNGTQVLLMRGTRLPQGAEAGYVVLFDDISHLLQAERQAAWGEVARRLAHEIKNPLTPIQLSAERLQHKLSAHLNPADAQLLQRATQTIVSQVGALKNMVSDFANYARGPVVKLTPLDLHQLIREVLNLYEANEMRMTATLHSPYAIVQGDATRLRQVIHNLLQNAQDALQGQADAHITLSTSSQGGNISLLVADNGSGFSDQVLSRAFEPYMTTKSKGTGLGLAIVKKIIEEHNGQISIENNINGGATITITLPTVMEVA
ncbi:MAG: ATP-binding protein [Gallionella sp.]|nr:ATP-binding protein [Gallionella sp.]